ncbi:hypothetical protein K445DRAFT_316905 [Daldinia sp. EC12]|nr:hypothetical protein K445DRAFT_316905 [Daldinia sp. EC12]
MANPSQDLVDEDLESLREEYGAISLTPHRRSSSRRRRGSIYSDSSLNQGDEDVFGGSRAFGSGVHVLSSGDEYISRQRVNSCTIGYDDQIDGGYTHQSILDHKDKGKAPVRVRRDFVDRRHHHHHPRDAEIPNANPRSYTEPTDAEIRYENLESRKYSSSSSTSISSTTAASASASTVNSAYEELLNESLSEYGVGLKKTTQLLSPKPSLEALSVVESDCESFRTASPKLYLDDDDQDRSQDQDQDQDQRQGRERERDDAESDTELEPQPQPQSHSAEPEPAAGGSGGGPHTSEDAETPAFRSLQYGDPGWEKSADRPPKKLPIRFKDAVGRKFIFPWEKAKTWAGMERLIRNCFAYVDIIGPHVIKGHYDLFTFHLPFSTDTGFEMAPPASDPVVASGAGEPFMSGSSNQPPVPHAPTPPPAPALTPVEQSAVTILPELWEDLVEPGMFILMQMWPMAPPALAPPPPMQQQQQQHPPPPLGPPNILDWIGGGRGRGRGRGGGGGVGPGGGPGGRGMNPTLPGWMVERTPKPRGKTRKRRDGP